MLRGGGRGWQRHPPRVARGPPDAVRGSYMSTGCSEARRSALCAVALRLTNKKAIVRSV